MNQMNNFQIKQISNNKVNTTVRVLSNVFKSLSPRLSKEEESLLSSIRKFNEKTDVVSQIEKDLFGYGETSTAAYL